MRDDGDVSDSIPRCCVLASLLAPHSPRSLTATQLSHALSFLAICCAGYKVSCDANGQTGTYSVCTDENCGDCPVTTRFRTDQCLPNPPQYGSASVSIRCPGAGSDFQPGQAPGNGNTTIRIITTAPSATLAPASSSGPSTGAASGDRSSTGGGSSGAAGGVAVGAGAIVAFVVAAVAVMRME